MEALINIDVPDLERAILFYEDGLGLRLRRKLFSGTVAEMAGVPSPIYLLAKPQGSAPSSFAAQPRAYSRHWTPVHLDFRTRDLDAALGRALAAGALLERPIESAAWGRMANFADPFGHGLCLVELGPRGYDALLA